MQIEVLVGMIASGKSSYARKRAGEGALVVCHDDLIQMLHGGVYRYDQGLRESYRTMEERLAWVALFSQRDVIIDRTHLTRESRSRWLLWCRNVESCGLAKIPVVAVRFAIWEPHIHAERRAEDDPRGLSYEEWLRVARRHWDQAQREPLSEDEGFDRIVSCERNL